MKKKLLALLLACCMVFGMLPAVSAVEAQEFTRIPVDDPTDITGGTYLIYGTSSQVMEDGSASAFMTAEGASSTRLMSRNLPITSDTVTTDDNYCVWNLIEANGGFLIQNAATSAYLYYGEGSGNSIYQTTDLELAGIWTVISNNNGWTLQEAGSGRQLSCNRFGSEGSYYLGYASYESDSTTLRSLEFFKLGASVTEPEDTEPIVTEPVATAPVETTVPVETEPVETTVPVETEPVETKPVETEPVVTDPSKPEKPEGAPDESGIWGDNLTWELYGTTLFISGEGDMAAERYAYYFPWEHLSSTLTHLVIEEGVTSVSNEAFMWFRSIEHISFPETMTSLGYRSFDLCESLTEVYLPDSITEMSDGVFEYCYSLSKINIPKNITSIPDRFVQGSAITEIEIPDTVTIIGSDAFRGCTSLTQVDLPDGLEVLGSAAFEGCSGITSIEIPAGVTELQRDIFAGTGLTEIVVPDTVTIIAQRAFANCANLKSVVLPQNLTDLDHQAFSYCYSLTEIDLPDTLQRISSNCFIAAGLVHITIPDSVTYIDDSAFSSCTALETVDLSENLEHIGSYAFWGCSSLKTITLPNSLKSIDMNAFYESGLVSIVIPDSVTELGSELFRACTDLESVLIPDSVTDIGDYAFYQCDKVTVYCYELSYAHMYAEANAIPYQILEEEPDTPFYYISISCNAGGSVATVPDISPANRYVVVEMLPDSGYVPATIHYFCVDDPYHELIFQQVSDTMLIFLMPASDVELEIHFMPEECPFVDVKETDYFYSPVLWALTYDITSGVSANRFGPNNACTRAQVVTFLWAAAGRPEPTSYYNPFTDVKETDYYYKAVLWAVENGITSGMSATTFGSSNPCTRAQVVTFLWAALGRPEPNVDYNPFRDVKETDYYYKAVLFAMEYGITSGMSENTFGSNSTCTRAHVVTFLYRTFWG